MLFYISKKKEYNNSLGLECRQLGDFWLFHDRGWIIDGDTARKGTSNNWCLLDFSKGLTISHNNIRDFPLWHGNDSVSNCENLSHLLPTDAKITYDNGWHTSYNTPQISESTVDETKALNLIADVLIDNTRKFNEANDLPLMAPNNTGLDTLLSRSIFDHLGIKYDLFNIDQTKYHDRQLKMYERHWGFNQIQNFDVPSCVISGFYGDEYLLRNPAYVQCLINEDVVQMFDKQDSCYMKHFFNLKYKDKCSKLSTLTKDKVKEMIINDIQVWHIDDVYVFNPYRDMRLLELLNCDIDVISKQVTDGFLSKKLLERFNPALYKLLDKEKNTKEPTWFEDSEYLKK